MIDFVDGGNSAVVATATTATPRRMPWWANAIMMMEGLPSFFWTLARLKKRESAADGVHSFGGLSSPCRLSSRGRGRENLQ